MRLSNNCLLNCQQPFILLTKTRTGYRVVAMNHKKVIWITGLSGAGKSTLATGLSEAIRHDYLPWEGWMWHPEREKTFLMRDINRFKALLS